MLAGYPLLASMPAQAQDFAHVSSLTNADLRRLCNADAAGPGRRSVSLTPCTSYILGAADQLSVSKAFCLSSADYASVVIKEVMAYLRQHAEAGNQPPAMTIRTALNTAFPCDAL